MKASHFKDCYCIKVISVICMMDSCGSTPRWLNSASVKYVSILNSS